MNYKKLIFLSLAVIMVLTISVVAIVNAEKPEPTQPPFPSIRPTQPPVPSIRPTQPPFPSIRPTQPPFPSIRPTQPPVPTEK